MGIKETQEDLIRQKLILEELRQGQFPSLSAIEEKLARIVETRRLGLPRFTYRPMNKGKASDTDAYNAMFAEAEDDLITSFEEVRRLNNRIMALSNYYESNRIRIDRELKRIELKTETLLHRSRSHLNRDVLSDNINDFSKVEFKGDTVRNLPRTTAFVDLRHSEVHLDKVAQQTTKHDLSSARVSFKTLTDGARVVHLSPIRGCLVDNLNEAWRSIILSPEASGAIGELTISLDAPLYATNISIDAQCGRPMLVTLYLSTDGDNFVEYETRRVVSSYQWVFDRTAFQHIRFRMEKREEDSMDASEYGYIFGAKSIEVREEQYLSEGYFVSKPYPIHHHEAIDYIHLEADDYIPPGTNIRYYVGMDYGDNVIEWHEIEKNRPVEMKMVQAYRMEIDSYVDGYGDQLYTKFGHNYYRIAKLPFKPLTKSIQLLMGRHMWLKETIPAEVSNPEDGSVYQTSIRDWIRAGSASKEYMNIDNYQDILAKDTFQRYTTYVYLEESLRYNADVHVDADASLAILVNNNQVKSVNNIYQLPFRPGWNKIEVLTYSRKEAQEIIFNLYLREISDRIYANNQSLQEVSLYDLLNNTSIRLHNRFAVDDDWNIIVNYNPKEMDIRRHGVEYSLTYNYSVSPQTNHQLRFMAILSKEDPNSSASPRLKDYKLVIE